MDQKELQQRVTKVVCNVLKVDATIVEATSNFVFDLGAESTQSIQLVAGFEDEFGVELDNEAALKVQTVGDAMQFIGQYV
jgi:acyl carrier protein